MNANSSFSEFVRRLGGALILGTLAANAHGAATALGTEPFTLGGRVNALPNVMFVLDDSGSMKGEYLPDWAGPYLAADTSTVLTPAHRFFNGAYNGVAYNPGTYYQPPVMYDNTGARDTTTYPSQTGQSAAVGGDGTATTLAPNWRAVKVDGYGIQSTAMSNLEGNAYSYTTVAGEYCTSGQLRTCDAYAAPTGLYTFPARLRWCTTSANAVDTTANAGTSCQASNIDPASGVTSYTFARMPRPATSTITVTGTGTVTGITVGGAQILSASAAGGTTTDVATAIAANINACTLGIAGSCTVVGYSATSLADVVTVAAPGAITSTPVITGGTATPTAFSGGNVPGSTLFTVITPTVNSYPYPGTAAKASNRTDCAGATCTYAEEMTNYANWYAYYRTRMQMMKTAAGIAFSAVDDKFRVGYSSINNSCLSGGVPTGDCGAAFLNPSAFDGTQKNLWYTKFFAAVPYGQTPLRNGLAETGRLYAGKKTILNGVTANDPMQYSCQQNFTILSTDGYWNDTPNPKQIDGVTDIGNQDHNDPRPYYDGGTQTRTLSQTWWHEEQWAANTALFEQRTQQQQTTTSRLRQSVVTTDTYPFTLQTTQLQTRTTPLTKRTYNLISTSYPLIDTTRQLQKNETFIQRTTRPLERYTFNPVETTTPLRKSVTNITVTTYPLEKWVQSPQARITQLQVGTQSPQSRTYPLETGTETVSKLISALQKMTETINLTRSPLQKTETFIEATTRQLQLKDNISTDGGDTWHDSAWIDTSSCTVTPGTVSTNVRNRRCQYAAPVVTGGQTSCAVVAASPGPTNYTVGLARACVYEAPSAPVAVGTCTVRAQSGTFAATQIACGYGAAAAPVTGLHSCIANNQGGPSYTGDRVVCGYDSASWVAAGACTASAPASYSGDRISCQFVAGTPTTPASCVDVPQAGPAYTGDRTTCSYNSVSWASSGTCNPVTPAPAYSANRITCRYNATPSAYADVGSCTAYSQATTSPMTGDKVQCRHNPTVSWADAVPSGSETCTPNTPPAYATAKITCRYSGTGAWGDVASCTANNQVVTSPMSGDKVECQYNPTVNWVATGACTPNTPASYSGSQTTCRYRPTASSTNTGQTTCTPRNQPTTGAMTLDGVDCAWDTTITTTSTSPCTWNVPATPISTRTTCAYDPAFNTTATPASCTPVPQVNSNTANGQVWSGSIVACGYAAAVVTTLDPVTGSCTPTGSSAGPPFSSYTTCGWGTGVVATGLSSCTKRNALAGPFTNGAFIACAYQGTPTTTDVTVGTCTTVAQDTTNFTATGVTCTYAAATTPTVAGCTNVAMSPGPTYAVLNSHSCAYGAGVTTDPAAGGTCNAVPQTGPNFVGPAVDCSYSASVSSTLNNQTSCLQKNAQAGPGFSGGGTVDCTYGTTSGWSNVASGTCTYKDPMTPLGSDGINYVQAVECAYNPPSVDTLVDNTCPTTMAVAGNSGGDGTAYSVLQKKVCVAGAFPVVGSAVVTTVDNCSTDPTSVTNNGVVTSTATACTYRAPVTVNTAFPPGCTPVPVSGGSPYVSSVTCPVTDTGFVAVTPGTCTPAGALPAAFDATGKIVECRTTDTTVYNATYPIGPVAVDSCTVGVTVNPTTKVQTTCVKPVATNTAAVPVDPTTCTQTTTPVGPNYIWTMCSTIPTTTTVRGCLDQAPTSPEWKTITCADDGTGTINTLADVAAYYYKTDLRTPAFGNCSGAIVPPATTASILCSSPASGPDPLNNVPFTPKDPNNAQHMTTFTLGLGASGYMKYSDTYLTDTSGDFFTVKGIAPYLPDNGIAANPATGVCSWQSIDLCNWPEPVSDQQTTIDDLWHAGVNGHGAYFSATDPTSLSASIASALAGVAAAGGASASPTISNPSLTPGDSYIFSSTYTTLDWTGELVRRQLNPVTGAVSPNDDWAVQDKLDAKSYASRAIWTFDNSVATTKLRAFTSANFAANTNFLSPQISTSPTGLTQFLCSSPTTCLTATDQDSAHAAGANLVKFLRGDRSNEGTETDNTKYYRQRQHVLGDVVNAQVVYVNKPLYNYADPGYDAYIVSQAARQPIAYAGANDGMLHAFYATGTAATEAAVDAAAQATNAAVLAPGNAALATAAAAAAAAANAAVAADTIIGQELWAYIPTMVIPNLYRLADKKYKDKHRYYVDGTPIVGDICIGGCATPGTAVWKTILVGGLARGGRGYYALDITVPASPKALWEFTDTNMGYTYGSPQIAKLADGTWVVLVTSGYNNIANEDGAGGDGVGRLYVLDAVTGVLIRSISTGVGDTTDPSGLAQITAQVVNPSSDNSIEAVYGGDLYGNLWRFDVNNDVGAVGFDAQLLAVLKDGAGNRQLITTKPQVAAIPTTGEKIVFVGTGGYLAVSDADNVSQQSLYAIKDPRAVGTTPGTAIFDNPGGAPRLTGVSTTGFVRQIQTEELCPAGALASICSTGQMVRTSTSNTVDYQTQNGWFVDLLGTSERANTDPALALGELVFTTNAPSLLACDVGGSSYTYFLSYLTGGPIGGDSPTSTIRHVVGKLLANQLGSSPTLAVTKEGKLISITGLAGGGITVVEPPLPPGASITRRTSWRELIRE